MKTNLLNFRVRADEVEAIDRLALESGLSRSDYIRQSVLDGKGVRKFPNKDLLRQILVELRRQGGNLNQIAKAMNVEPGSIAQQQLKAIFDQYQKARISIEKAMAG